MKQGALVLISAFFFQAKLWTSFKPGLNSVECKEILGICPQHPRKNCCLEGKPNPKEQLKQVLL